MPQDLTFYRAQIDEIDEKLLQLLAQRVEVVKQVGIYKKQHNLPALNQNRWQEILNKLRTLAKNNNLDEDLIVDLWNRIHEYTLSLEEEILENL
jgi:chorismate mutase